MPNTIIIGAGVNGLVTACYLAKAGLQPLVLERRAIPGGISVTEEIVPGFKCSTVAHTAGPLLPHVLNDLQLSQQGLEIIQPEARVTALNPAGSPLTIFDDAKRTASDLAKHSVKDATSYLEFAKCFSRIGEVLEPLTRMTPPAIDNPKPSELWNLGKLGLAFRGLGKTDAYRLLRWGPMAVADLVAEWFELELLRATIAVRGIFGNFAGPWSAGTSAGLLMQAAMDRHATAPAAFCKGGMGALVDALISCARAHGAEIRTSTEVERVIVKDRKAAGVLLKDGEEITAQAVVSSADPRTTFLKLIDPLDLDPNFLGKIRNYRSQGSAAKVNLALSALPNFIGIETNEELPRLSGRIHIGPEIDYLERAFDAAKYGQFSSRPLLEIVIPSLSDNTLAPGGGHVMSIHVQFAPYKLREGDWSSRRDEFADLVVNLLAEYAPDIKEKIVGRQVITPVDLEEIYGLNGGHLMHGEQALDQFFTFRPLLGWARYRAPIGNLYLCGAGTHPGGGVTGGPGANASREILSEIKR